MNKEETWHLDFDTKSIMHYHIPAHLTTNNQSVPENYKLSALDLSGIRALYPDKWASQLFFKKLMEKRRPIPDEKFEQRFVQANMGGGQQCMTIDTVNGQHVIKHRPKNAADPKQRWTFTRIASTGYFVIVSRAEGAAGLVLTPDERNLYKGGCRMTVSQFRGPDAGLCQMWELFGNNTGSYVIANAQSKYIINSDGKLNQGIVHFSTYGGESNNVCFHLPSFE